MTRRTKPTARSGRAISGSSPPTREGEPPPIANRERMLDAAEEVILRDGIGRLTLQAVASESRLSKSGLLHHLPSKDALIEALVQRIVSRWQTQTAAAIEAEASGPGRVPRAILGRCFASTGKWTADQRRSSLVLVAALVHDHRHVESLRKAHRALQERIETDGLPPGVGSVVQLTVNGVWFDWIFGLTEWSPRRLGEIRAALVSLLDGAIAGKGGGGARARNGPSSNRVERTATARSRAVPSASGRTRSNGKERRA